MSKVYVCYDMVTGVIWGSAHSAEKAAAEATRFAPAGIHKGLWTTEGTEALFDVLENLGGDVRWFLGSDHIAYSPVEKSVLGSGKAAKGGTWMNPSAVFNGTEPNIYDPI